MLQDFGFCQLPDSYAVQGLAVKATRGNALLFYSLLPNGESDPSSLHGSCPTTKGDKYSATKWVRSRASDTVIDRLIAPYRS